MSAVGQKPESKTSPQIANRLGFSSARNATWLILPGLAISVGIAIFAFALRQIPGVASFSPMILAVMLGPAVHNLIGVPGKASSGSCHWQNWINPPAQRRTLSRTRY